MGGGRTSTTNMAGGAAAALVVSDLAAVPFGLTHEFAHVFGRSSVVKSVSTTTTTYSSSASTTMTSMTSTLESASSSSNSSSSSSGTSPSSVKRAGERVPRFVWHTLTDRTDIVLLSFIRSIKKHVATTRLNLTISVPSFLFNLIFLIFLSKPKTKSDFSFSLFNEPRWLLKCETRFGCRVTETTWRRDEEQSNRRLTTFQKHQSCFVFMRFLFYYVRNQRLVIRCCSYCWTNWSFVFWMWNKRKSHVFFFS